MEQDTWLFQAAHVIRQAFIETLAPDIVHISSLVEWWDVPISLPPVQSCLPSSLTLYDLIPLKRPDALPPHPQAQQWYRSQIAQISQASLVLAISEYARQEALQALALDPSRVVTIAAGVSEVFFGDLPDDAATRANFLKAQGIEKPFALVVGVIEPRKNNLRLVEAWAQLPPSVRHRHQLVFVASTICPTTFKALIEALKRHNIPDQEVIFLQDQSDHNLHLLYSACRVFILPSLQEGFGLPAAEAMVCGAATIGSNATSIPEVIGWQEALFDPTSVDQIREKLLQVLTDEAFLLALKQHAKSRADQFSWDAVAQRAMAAFTNTVSTAPVREPGVTPDAKGDLYRDRLLYALAAIPFAANQANLCAAASAVAANRPRNYRQLLIDVSVLAVSDSQTGIQRVVRNFSKQLLQNPPLGFQVRLVRCLKHLWVWQYATQLEQKILGQQTSVTQVREPVLEVFAGDVFLGADLGLEYVPNQRAWFDRARHRGVDIQFIVYDILPVRMPQYSHAGILSLFLPWLQEITQISSRLICISKTVADELGSWYVEQGFSLISCP
ncbi:MAG: glycosyltransferase [Nodosilinea sp. LVE1205-7]|jgi:glycosyltransferase involved in cell wall biosynthesis